MQRRKLRPLDFQHHDHLISVKLSEDFRGYIPGEALRWIEGGVDQRSQIMKPQPPTLNLPSDPPVREFPAHRKIFILHYGR